MTFKRGRRADTVAGPRMVWESRDGQFRIEQSRVNYLPVIWRACRRIEGRWEIVSRHRRRSAAEKACEKAATRRRR